MFNIFDLSDIKSFFVILAESPSNTSDSPSSVSPLSSSIVLQREGTTVNQPLSAPASPLSSLSSPVTQLNLPSPGDCTQDPNWQATKPTVRERNAAMFNNHLMADIIFIVGSPGTYSNYLMLFLNYYPKILYCILIL